MQRPYAHQKDLRKGRFSLPGTYYFLTTTAYQRRKIFVSERRAEIILDALRWLSASNRFFVDAAVVMPDHVHIAGQLANSILARVMHTLKSFTAKQLVAEGATPPIWQRAYHDHALRDDEDYRIRVRYLLDNPVRAGLVSRVEDYPYLILPEWW